MKFTLSWLKDHLKTTASVDEISTKLSAIGLEVESVEDPAQKLGAFRVARIVEAKKHPNADKLQIVQVEVEQGKPLYEVVCGAPNARAGMLSVFAPIGTYVPGLGVTLEKKPVRGVISNGMMCSAAELELSTESSGILDLPAELGDKVGERYIDAAGINDPVFEIKITPNRPDCTGVRGVARDLAAAGLGTLKPEKAISGVEGAAACPVSVSLEFTGDTADACPVFAARLISGVKNGPSPEWLQTRLRAVGLRPINALVDVTNYISQDRGRPLHVYDAAKLKGGVKARLGKSGETLEALDAKSYKIDETMCVIADDAGPLALGGIIGGAQSGSSEETTSVLVESAYFAPLRTAATGRKTGLVTDARYRFERGVDPESVLPGLDLATQMILKLCGGKPSKAVVAGKVPDTRRAIVFDTARVAKLGGIELAEDRITSILETLGCEILAGEHGMLEVTPPSWRPDIHGSADLVEEVVRIAGIDNIPAVPLPRMSGVARPVLTDKQKRARRSRRLLAARGLVEAVTWSFGPKKQAQLFGAGEAPLELANPISVDLAVMRPSLLPGLVTAAERNRNRGFADVGLFELGQAYKGEAPSDQLLIAAGVRAGTATTAGAGRSWDGGGRAVSVFDAKADVTALLAALGFDASKAQIVREAPAWYHPGRSGLLKLGPKVVLAAFGELHPETLKALDATGPIVAFEVFLDALPPEKKKSRAKAPMASMDLLPVRRDFAFVVSKSVSAGEIVKAASAANKALIQTVSVFDVFEGGSLGEQGRKSIAIEVTMQPEATMTEQEIDAVSKAIIAEVQKATGGEIRA